MSRGERSNSSENRMLVGAVVGGVAMLGCLAASELAIANKAGIYQFVIEQMVPLIAPPVPYLNEQLSGIDMGNTQSAPAVHAEVGLHPTVLVVPGK